MTWHSVRVRTVTPDDLPVLLDLAEELREQLLEVPSRSRASSRTSSRTTAPRLTPRLTLEDRYREAVEDPDRHLLLAVSGAPGEEQVLGMAMLVVGATNALLDTPAVHVSHAVVAGRQRRRGAGRALVAAAASFAEERGIEHLVVSVSPTSREAARFFARLGFAPAAVRRTAPVSVVRRKLAAPERTVEVLGRRAAGRPRAVAARVRQH